jgi:hypothetical protein
MTNFSPGASWIQWCTWISGSPLVPTEELVFGLVEVSEGRLIPAPREGVSAGAGPRWGLTDVEERLYLLIGDERTEIRQIVEDGVRPTKSPSESFILIPPFLVDNAERAEIGVCRTFPHQTSSLTWNRWLRIRKGSSSNQSEGFWLEVDVNTLESPLPKLENHQSKQQEGDAQASELPSYSPEAFDLMAAKTIRSIEARERRQKLGEAGKDAKSMPLAARGIQAKLTVGEPGDAYEQEADRVAARVMSMPSPMREQQPTIQGNWAIASPQKDRSALRRFPKPQAFQSTEPQASGDLESRLNASKGGGSPLAPKVRAFMEPRFGADFSQVRVHTGSEAVQMNRELGAQAFARGQDIYFGAGKSPGNNELTAHELTHVVQQTGKVQQHSSKTNLPMGLISRLPDTSTIQRNVTVGLYEGAMRFGHVGVGVNSRATTGLYPHPDEPQWRVIRGVTVRGIVQPDEAALIDRVVVNTSPQQDRQIQASIQQAIGAPPQYNLYSSNCAHHAANMLGAGGVNVERSKFPRIFFENVRRRAEVPQARGAGATIKTQAK